MFSLQMWKIEVDMYSFIKNCQTFPKVIVSPEVVTLVLTVEMVVLWNLIMCVLFLSLIKLISLKYISFSLIKYLVFTEDKGSLVSPHP